jgi:hypothetical protein
MDEKPLHSLFIISNLCHLGNVILITSWNNFAQCVALWELYTVLVMLILYYGIFFSHISYNILLTLGILNSLGKDSLTTKNNW